MFEGLETRGLATPVSEPTDEEFEALCRTLTRKVIPVAVEALFDGCAERGFEPPNKSLAAELGADIAASIGRDLA